MKLGDSLPHSQETTTCPNPSQINPFLCPSYFWQEQVVSFLVGLRTYQHPGKFCELSDRRSERWRPNAFIFRRVSSVSSFELNRVTLSHRHWTLYLERITELQLQEWPNRATVSCSKFSQRRSRRFRCGSGRAFVLRPLMTMRLFEISQTTRPGKRCDTQCVWNLTCYLLRVSQKACIDIEESRSFIMWPNNLV